MDQQITYEAQSMRRWVVQSGSLFTSVEAPTAAMAILCAIDRESPDHLGEILSALEEGQPSIFARFFHTESFLKQHNLLSV